MYCSKIEIIWNAKYHAMIWLTPNFSWLSTTMIESRHLPLTGPREPKTFISLQLRAIDRHALSHLIPTQVITQTTEKDDQENIMSGTQGGSDTGDMARDKGCGASGCGGRYSRAHKESEIHQNGPSIKGGE